MKFITAFLIFLMVNSSLIVRSQHSVRLTYLVAAELMNGEKKSIGFAGMVSGVSNDVLIMAGGANFPNEQPYRGGKKFYSDKIFVLEKSGNDFVWNKNNQTKLPEPIAYAASATTEKGMVYVGGDNENGISAKSYLLNWDKTNQQVQVSSLPDLPVAVTSASMATNGNKIFVLCGDESSQSSNQFFELDLNKKNPEWQRLPDVPVALANGMAVYANEKIYLIGGRTKSTTGISELRSSTFVFDLKKKTWKSLADIFDGKSTTPFTAGVAFALNNETIIALGADKGDVFHQIENYLSKISKATSEEEKQKLIAEKNELVIHHQGFSTDVLKYDIVKNEWTKIGAIPYAAQVTTSLAKWNNNYFICSGEIRPGVRSPKIIDITIIGK